MAEEGPMAQISLLLVGGEGGEEGGEEVRSQGQKQER